MMTDSKSKKNHNPIKIIEGMEALSVQLREKIYAIANGNGGGTQG